MKKLIPILALAISTSAFASPNTTPQSDAAQAHAMTKKVRNVAYSCQQGKKVTVRYGFDKNNKPTYAEASLNGERRFMPLNIILSDATGTTFGDQDNFSLSANALTLNNVARSSVNIQDPAGEILYKGCTAGKGKRR